MENAINPGVEWGGRRRRSSAAASFARRGPAEQKDGTSVASRIFDRQRDAEAHGRAQAKREGAELVIKVGNGGINRRDSHGADDPAMKG